MYLQSWSREGQWVNEQYSEIVKLIVEKLVKAKNKRLRMMLIDALALCVQYNPEYFIKVS